VSARLALVLVAALAFAASLACGGDDEEVSPEAPPGNLLLNPGFEQGPEPWITLSAESGFEVTQELAFAGLSSAVLRMADPAEAEGSKVYYLVQEVTPATFPDLVRGAFRIENWLKGTPKQYVQLVVIAFGADNDPTPAENFQLRYILGGVNVAPLDIANAQYIFLTQGDPIVGDWVTFEANIREDFQNFWNAVPENFDKIRVLFEVRYDDKVAGDGAVEANLYWDELYVGSSSP
jgi:hypothetical protein